MDRARAVGGPCLLAAVAGPCVPDPAGEQGGALLGAEGVHDEVRVLLADAFQGGDGGGGALLRSRSHQEADARAARSVRFGRSVGGVVESVVDDRHPFAGHAEVVQQPRQVVGHHDLGQLRAQHVVHLGRVVDAPDLVALHEVHGTALPRGDAGEQAGGGPVGGHDDVGIGQQGGVEPADHGHPDARVDRHPPQPPGQAVGPPGVPAVPRDLVQVLHRPVRALVPLLVHDGHLVAPPGEPVRVLVHHPETAAGQPGEHRQDERDPHGPGHPPASCSSQDCQAAVRAARSTGTP